VTNRPYVAVRLIAIKFFFRHFRPQGLKPRIFYSLNGTAEAAP